LVAREPASAAVSRATNNRGIFIADRIKFLIIQSLFRWLSGKHLQKHVSAYIELIFDLIISTLQ
jgi:hypothetical protein